MMAKKCDCHGLVDMLERDPRLRALPLAPRMLWFALLRAMQSLSGSVLRFGSHCPNPTEIAMLIGVSESELEANLGPLLVRGLLEREVDGALSSPLLRGLAVRSEINRANGLKGGAARKAQAEARRAQMTLALPIVGGREQAVAAAETEPEANAAAPPTQLKLNPSSPSKPKLVVDDGAFHRTGRAAFEAAGFDPARSTVNYGIVRQWLADGATEGQILETIQAAIARGAKPAHLGYFTKAVREAAARAAAPGGAEPTARSMAWEYALGQWRLDGKRGRMPLPTDFGADGLPVSVAA